MSSPHIVVVGSSNTDMVVKSKRIPAPGETVVGGTFVMAPGGKGANQAVAAARLGAEVTFLAKVGADMFGDQAIQGYQAEGIQTEHILRDADQATGVALILVDDEGENSISVASGANFRFTAEDIERMADVIRRADAVMFQLETPLATVTRAAEIATAASVPVILDPAPAPDEGLPDALLASVDYLTPNETEAARLTGTQVHDEQSARAAAAMLQSRGAKNVLITLGAAGVIVASTEQTEWLPATDVQAVDSTAAGDAFNGALAVALGQGKPLRDAVQYASRVAALSVTKMGAQPSLPTVDEVEKFDPPLRKA